MSEQLAPTSHSYFSQRLRLHYLDWGNDADPSAVLVHGVRDHCRTWDHVARHLRHRYHVVAPDLRGHGDSAWQRGSAYGNVDYVYDLAQLIRQRELAPVTLIAHSLGGTLACLFAGVYPELVARLVVIEGIGQWWRWLEEVPTDQRLREWFGDLRNLAGREPKRYATIEDAYQRMQLTNPHLSPELALHLTIHGSHQNEDGSFSWKFDNYTHAWPVFDVSAEESISLWRRIECPVLMINSTDGYEHRIGQDGTEQHFQDARVVDIEGAGHWTHHDQPDQVLAAIDAFLPR
jgi:pimeloyl-ACP methyl ester carboxylesterase